MCTICHLDLIVAIVGVLDMESAHVVCHVVRRTGVQHPILTIVIGVGVGVGVGGLPLRRIRLDGVVEARIAP